MQSYFYSKPFIIKISLPDVPSAPGVPEITDVTSYDIGLTWKCPDKQGRAGSVIGYQVIHYLHNKLDL